MAKGDLLRNMVIRRLGELCQAHSEVVTEKALLEVKILETVKVLEECFEGSSPLGKGLGKQKVVSTQQG